MAVCNLIYRQAQTLAADAGMQFDSRYSHWIAPRGRFEGQDWYAPYYWDCVMNGDGETLYTDQEEGPCGDLFHVGGDEAEAFELVCGSWILMVQDSQGFILLTRHIDREKAEASFRRWAGC